MVHEKIKALYQRLVNERRRLVGVAAENETLPASGLLAQISDLDGSIAATEAVLEEVTGGRRQAAE